MNGFFEEPTDTVIKEGESLQIPCSTCENETRTPFWRIGGIDYMKLPLPPPYLLQEDSLFIHQIKSSMNGTTFQCMLPADDGQPEEASCIGVLTVLPEGIL